jgi:hypothetical protein
MLCLKIDSNENNPWPHRAILLCASTLLNNSLREKSLKITSEMALGLLGMAAVSNRAAASPQLKPRQDPGNHFYATRRSGTGTQRRSVFYFDGKQETPKTQIQIPNLSSGVTLKSLSLNRAGDRVLVATGDGPGLNDISVIKAKGSSNFNEVIKQLTIQATINGVTVDRADLIFQKPKSNYVFFAQQGNGPVAIGAFDPTSKPNNDDPVAVAIKPLKLPAGTTVKGPLSSQAAFASGAKQLWWPVPNPGGDGLILIVNTDESSGLANFMKTTVFNVGPDFDPTGIAIMDGKAYVSGTGGTKNRLRVYDVDTRELENESLRGEGTGLNLVVASSSTNQIYADASSGNVMRIYADNGGFLDEVDAEGNNARSMKLTGDGENVYISSSNGIQVFDLTQSPPAVQDSFSLASPGNLAVIG